MTLAGCGIGTRLLNTLIDDYEARELRQMVAVIGDSANVTSIRLHLRCGFRNAGILISVGHEHGRWLDSVRIQRALRHGDTTPPMVHGR